MSKCKYYYDEFCVNDRCPMVADYCPVPDTPNVCRWEDRAYKSARWKGAGMGDYTCSLCDETVNGNDYKYCPNCGAYMKEDD